MTLIIIDGMDNTGKSTTIQSLQYVYQKLGLTVSVLHLDKPPAGLTNAESTLYQKQYYFETVAGKIESCGSDVLILDRGWISEYVYGQIYRGRTSLDVERDMLVMDMTVTKRLGAGNVYQFIFASDNANILKELEDGYSLSKTNDSLLGKEYDLFRKAAEISLIHNSYFLNPFDVADNNDNSKYEFNHTILHHILQCVNIC